MNMHERLNIPTPEETILIPFKAHLCKMDAAKKWGVDLAGYFREHRDLLVLFGGMVMGTQKRPEIWKQPDIRHQFYPDIGQWESFFARWLSSAQSPADSALFNLGVSIIDLQSPYEYILLDLIGFMYGAEAEEETKMFLYENDCAIYYYDDGTKKDLRKPEDFSLYFKMKYDEPTNSISPN